MLIDPGLLMSVIRNLVDNALKYTERGGVLVGTRTREGRTVIQVWDTGVGISPCDGERIFEECFRANDPVLDRSKGLGLGLSIARRMAQLLGCQLTYKSRPGKGSMFEVMLPVTATSRQATGAAGTDASGEAPSSGRVDESLFSGWTVVVVEDDPMVAKAVELSLEEIGIRVVTFPSAESALESEAILSADFYVSDFNLPGIDGLRLLLAIQARRATPVHAVLVTGETFPRREALEAESSWPVLFKPVEMAHLLAVMGEISGRMAQRYDTGN